MMTLEGYKFIENLYQGTRTEVDRGTRSSDKLSVIIKVLRNPNPRFKELVQFRNQYVITRNLEHRAIALPMALKRYGNGYGDAIGWRDRPVQLLTDCTQPEADFQKYFLAKL